MSIFRNLSATVFLSCLSWGLSAQERPALSAFMKKEKGFGVVAGDSLYSVKFQFRIQGRAGYRSKALDDLAAESFEFRVRRLRLKFEGFVYDPRLTYYIQLSFSRGDMDWRGPENSVYNVSPNLIRDAVIFYNPTEHLTLGFGQTKLPGNRQRVVSSGDQQFVDRSIVNSTFNIDRDFGFFAHLASGLFNFSGALTSGDGRNSVTSGSGLAYTGRIEFLPFGRFTGENDYIEGDLEREPTPKLSVGSTFSYNEDAVRQGGQVGGDLFEPRDLRNFEVDALLKYNGWAFYNEYMQRHTEDPITHDAENNLSAVYAGEGYLSQLSYLFENYFEIAGRYSMVTPFDALFDNAAFPELNEKQVRQVELGVTKYLTDHRLKVQANVLRAEYTDMRTDTDAGGQWGAFFQIELGI